MAITAGYDVGGAHLKIARVENGRVTAVEQLACALWQGLDKLSDALEQAAAITRDADHHAVTMTAELCELFPSRRDGVMSLCSYLSDRLGCDYTRFYSGLQGWTAIRGIADNWQSIASANFLATAQLVAQKRPHALLIDMGSTTTDIVACDRPQGLNDAERLQTGELVYTGFTRTSVAAVTSRGVLAGQTQGLARDTFATMADVRRVLGELPANVDLHETADGRGKSVEESLVRLARGFGRDAEFRHLPAWQIAAAHIREAQLRSIYDGAIQVMSRPGLEITNVVAAGVGSPVAETIARRLGLPCISFGDLVRADTTLQIAVTRYAPAVAVAILANS